MRKQKVKITSSERWKPEKKERKNHLEIRKYRCKINYSLQRTRLLCKGYSIWYLFCSTSVEKKVNFCSNPALLWKKTLCQPHNQAVSGNSVWLMRNKMLGLQISTVPDHKTFPENWFKKYLLIVNLGPPVELMYLVLFMVCCGMVNPNFPRT